jgi:pilus assembly protein Flp/PilA
MFSSIFKHEKGQGLVEYAIIVALVAVVVIGVMRVVGPKVGNTFSTVNTALDSSPGYSQPYSNFDQGWDEYCAMLPAGTSVSSYYANDGSSNVIFAPEGSPSPSGYSYYDSWSC